MEHFTNTELADMRLIYVLAEGNARAADRLCRERYPPRDAPDRLMLAKLCRNLCEYGSLRDNRHTIFKIIPTHHLPMGDSSDRGLISTKRVLLFSSPGYCLSKSSIMEAPIDDQCINMEDLGPPRNLNSLMSYVARKSKSVQMEMRIFTARKTSLSCWR
ncbi:hypothetical protein TNCV_5073811 [Trichonephila clavipes]|nr:hypothetical protein TNCV_5073811 [Trichonephila clavipes]